MDILAPPWSFAQIISMMMGASVWARDNDAEGHFKKQLLGSLHPSKLSLRRVNPLKGLVRRDEPFWMERRVREGWMEVWTGICALYWPFSLINEAFKCITNSLKFLSKVKHCSSPCCSIYKRPQTLCSKRHSTIEWRVCPWWESPDSCRNYDFQIAVRIRIKCSRDRKWPGERLCLFCSQHACVPQGSVRRYLIRRKTHLNTSRCWRTQNR